MQKLNTALIIVLLILVGYLFFSSSTASPETEVTETDLVEESVDEAEIDERIGVGKIAFINLDTLNAQYEFLEDNLAELRTEQGKSERRMANKVRKAEEEYMQLQEDARFMTEAEIQQAQVSLQNKQIELQEYQDRLANDLLKLEASMQEVLSGNIMSMVEEVNLKYGYDYVLAKSAGGGILIGNDAYDITTEVIDGLNSKYQAEQAAPEE